MQGLSCRLFLSSPPPPPVPLFALAPCVCATSPWLSLSPAKTPLRGNGKDCYAGYQVSTLPLVFILPVGLTLFFFFKSSKSVFNSAIWLGKQRVCSELTNNKTENVALNAKIISHTSTSATESQSTPESVDYDPQKEYLNQENSLKWQLLLIFFCWRGNSKTRASGFIRFPNTRKQ